MRLNQNSKVVGWETKRETLKRSLVLKELRRSSFSVGLSLSSNNTHSHLMDCLHLISAALKGNFDISQPGPSVCVSK